MAVPTALPLAHQVLPLVLNILEERGHVGRVDAFQRARITRDLARLEETDAFSASIGYSFLASIEGDEAEAERQVQRAWLIGDKDNAQVVRLFNLSNYGRASKALALARSVIRPGSAFLSKFLQALLPIGAVSTISANVDAAVAANHVLSADANPIIVKARAVEAALNAAGRTEDELAALIDIAGDVLRERGLLWQDRGPEIVVLDGSESEDSAPSVGFHYRVAVTPKVAAEMSAAVGWRAIDRDADRLGLTVAFIGTDIAALAA